MTNRVCRGDRYRDNCLTVQDVRNAAVTLTEEQEAPSV